MEYLDEEESDKLISLLNNINKMSHEILLNPINVKYQENQKLERIKLAELLESNPSEIDNMEMNLLEDVNKMDETLSKIDDMENDPLDTNNRANAISKLKESYSKLETLSNIIEVRRIQAFNSLMENI